MDLILKNQKSPECCARCRFHNAHICVAKMSSVPLDIYLRGQQPSDCPAKRTIQTPHGRLVDVDFILKYMEEHGYTMVTKEALEALPVIVEASEC